jgi:GAF domain-containing protein
MNETADAHRYFRALFDAAQAVTSSLEVEEVLQRLAESTVRVMGIKACVLRLLNEDGETLTLRAAYGLSERYLRKGPVVRAQSALDHAALQGQVVIVPNVATNPLFQYPQAAQEEGIASVLCVPLRAHGEAIGVMRAYTAEPHDFSEIEQEFVQALADLGALAIVNARRFESIQRDYHDTIDVMWGTSRSRQ